MTDAGPWIRRLYCLLIAAGAGAVVLGLEVLAARTMAPALGSGSAAWSALLSAALASLAVGNLLGGWLAGRVRAGAAIGWAFTLAAGWLVAFSQLHGPAMRWSAEQSLFLGASAAALATQFVPMLLLGMITPVLLRAGERRSRSELWSGAVLACGSTGGIGGALAIGLAILPAIGLSHSYLLAGGMLLLAAAPALLRDRRWLAGVLALAVLMLGGYCWTRPPARQVVQSLHGQLEVQWDQAGRTLLIDGLPQTALPGQLAPWEALRQGYLLEAGLLFQPEARSALVVGLGAGLAPRVLALHGVPCETVELDPAVVRIAREQFEFAGPVAIADGRAFLQRSDRQWDLIFVDVCTSERLPTHLFTAESMQTLRRRLSPAGLLVVQFIGDDGPWSASLARTVSQSFGPSLVLTPQPDLGLIGPRWLFAGQPVLARPQDLSLPWRILEPSSPGLLLTDDHFPSELAWTRTAALWRRLYGQ